MIHVTVPSDRNVIRRAQKTTSNICKPI
jgi:hypothetical protein